MPGSWSRRCRRFPAIQLPRLEHELEVEVRPTDARVHAEVDNRVVETPRECVAVHPATIFGAVDVDLLHLRQCLDADLGDGVPAPGGQGGLRDAAVRRAS